MTMVTSHPPILPPEPSERRRHGAGSGSGQAWTPDLPHPDWWVDGAQILGRDWAKVQGSNWDVPWGRPGGDRRRRGRPRRQDRAPLLPYAALAAARAAGPARPGSWTAVRRALGQVRRALLHLWARFRRGPEDREA
jgi:hypothetical protein